MSNQANDEIHVLILKTCGIIKNHQISICVFLASQFYPVWVAQSLPLLTCICGPNDVPYFFIWKLLFWGASKVLCFCFDDRPIKVTLVAKNKNREGTLKASDPIDESETKCSINASAGLM